MTAADAGRTAATPPLCQGPDPQPRKPLRVLPAHAIDCHCHVFADPERYPLAAVRSYTPHSAPLDQYLRMIDTLGVERTVMVNASVYGADNSISLDIIKKLGAQRARGVAGVSPDVSARELKRLDDGGMRGVRLATSLKGYGGIEVVSIIANKIKPLGWHVQLLLDRVAEVAALESQLLALPVPIVFDHLGRTRGAEGIDTPGFQALLRVLKARDDVWVKLSSWYRLSDAGGPDYLDMKPIAQALIAARPERMVWGSNWPHPRWDGAMPNDGHLVDLMCSWIGDDAAIERIFVTNPAQLYGFE